MHKLSVPLSAAELQAIIIGLTFYHANFNEEAGQEGRKILHSPGFDPLLRQEVSELALYLTDSADRAKLGQGKNDG